MDLNYSDDAVCARGGWTKEFRTRPSAPAIYQTTAFDMHGLEQLEAVAAGQEPGYIYTRKTPITTRSRATARLERAEAGVVAASGMGP